MASDKRPLIIPAEEQSRELNAKLLLASVAAARGFTCFVGERREIHLHLNHLPRGIYYAKSFRTLSLRIFRILNDLGHEIVACDEEALLTMPDEVYYERRLCPETMGMITHLFAWGPENERLFAECPHYTGAPIHVTGNPRIDLMRSELRGCLDLEAEVYRERYGDFILINTNFGTINHRVASLSWLSFLEIPEDESLSHEEEFKIAATRHRMALFTHFKEVLPVLARRFPRMQIVLRPHPLEAHAPWQQAAQGCENVHIVHEGNVLPWMLAAKAIVQNNCTTAIEGYILDRPIVSYLPVQSERFDLLLTNAMGHPAYDADHLCSLLAEIIGGKRGVPTSGEPRRMLERYISGLNGRLASDRIVDALEAAENDGGCPPTTTWLRESLASLHVHARTLGKIIRAQVPGDKNSRVYQVQRFPGLRIEEVRERIRGFERALGQFEKRRVEEVARNIYRID